MTDDQRRAPSPGGAREPRSADDRAADHAAIQRLAEDLVPALIAKLSASGLGEIEIAEEAWTIRVRRPGETAAGHGRRLTDKPSRSQPGHAGHGHAPGSFEGHRSAREVKGAPVGGHPSSNGAAAPAAFGSEAGSPAGHRPIDGGGEPHRVVATSPAVGVFQPRADLSAGSRVRNGDRLGAVDMLGIPQEVIAPADGILGASLVEAGQAVEYGQELVVIELAGRTADRSEV